MWELLKKLEDLGWKPYGKSIAELTETEKNVRLLTSRSSGLWQFCVENGMINVPHPNEGKCPRDKFVREEYRYWDRVTGYYREDNENVDCYSWERYEYRLIESALTDEYKLEQFLLDNIKIEGKND